jgi:hypothetical protein
LGRVRRAVEREPALGDAVGDTTRDGAEVRVPGNVFVERIKSQRDVRDVAFAIGHVHLGDDAAVGHHLHRQAVAVRQRVEINGLAVLGRAEISLGDVHLGTS